MNATPLVTRFAPSPTGELHLGNARTALFSFLLARAAHGRFLLRIEDTDAARSLEAHEATLMADLRWLGLEWNAGPDRAAPEGPFRQSQRVPQYRAHLDALLASGHAYRCFCSVAQLETERAEQRAAGRPPRYSGRCAGVSAADSAARAAQGEAHTLRFRVPTQQALTFEDLVRGAQQFRSEDIGDFVVARADGSPAFFFTNALDDALMGVTHVLRGEDHLSNTPRQILLLQALGLPVPYYGHLPLLVGDDGAPLSKRSGSLSLRALRETGYLPGAVVNHLARLGHHYEHQAALSLEALGAGFDLARVGRSPARHDPARLEAWQREVLASLDAAALSSWAADALTQVPESERAAFVAAVRDNIALPTDVAHWAQVVYGAAPTPNEAASVAAREAGADFYRAAAALVPAHGTDFKALAGALKSATGRKGKQLFQPLRAALTGAVDGPELATLLPLIGAGRAQARLAAMAGSSGKQEG